MEKRVQCTACRKTFEVVGESGRNERARGVTCCYCLEANEVDWSDLGTFFVRAIPEYMEGRIDPKPILKDQEKQSAEGAQGKEIRE
jgi:hypothetical protein